MPFLFAQCGGRNLFGHHRIQPVIDFAIPLTGAFVSIKCAGLHVTIRIDLAGRSLTDLGTLGEQLTGPCFFPSGPGHGDLSFARATTVQSSAAANSSDCAWHRRPNVSENMIFIA